MPPAIEPDLITIKLWGWATPGFAQITARLIMLIARVPMQLKEAKGLTDLTVARGADITSEAKLLQHSHSASMVRLRRSWRPLSSATALPQLALSSVSCKHQSAAMSLSMLNWSPRKLFKAMAGRPHSHCYRRLHSTNMAFCRFFWTPSERHAKAVPMWLEF